LQSDASVQNWKKDGNEKKKNEGSLKKKPPPKKKKIQLQEVFYEKKMNLKEGISTKGEKIYEERSPEISIL